MLFASLSKMPVRLITNGVAITFFFPILLVVDSSTGPASNFLLCEIFKVGDVTIPLGLEKAVHFMGSESLSNEEEYCSSMI